MEPTDHSHPIYTTSRETTELLDLLYKMTTELLYYMHTKLWSCLIDYLKRLVRLRCWTYYIK